MTINLLPHELADSPVPGPWLKPTLGLLPRMFKTNLRHEHTLTHTQAANMLPQSTINNCSSQHGSIIRPQADRLQKGRAEACSLLWPGNMQPPPTGKKPGTKPSTRSPAGRGTHRPEIAVRDSSSVRTLAIATGGGLRRASQMPGPEGRNG